MVQVNRSGKLVRTSVTRDSVPLPYSTGKLLRLVTSENDIRRARLDTCVCVTRAGDSSVQGLMAQVAVIGRIRT